MPQPRSSDNDGRPISSPKMNKQSTTVTRLSSKKSRSWLLGYNHLFAPSMRIIFGIIWGIDGALKFSPGMVQALQSMMSTVGSGQPSFLAGWFAFWSKLTLINPTAFVYAQGAVELTLSAALILGFMRKVTYIGGLMTSLLIWSVPEGFGGPYGPGTTDIGTGAIYAVVFLMLMVINATNGASRISLDWYIERKWPFWRHVAELQLIS